MESTPPRNPAPGDKQTEMLAGDVPANPARWIGESFMQFAAPEVTAREIFAVQGIQSVATLLHVLCNTTGMHLAGVARVTEQSWTLCAVQDAIGLDLKPGSQLDPKTTFCFEVKQSKRAIVIEHASADHHYRNHPARESFGMESYVAVPVILPSGRYFGNLFALDAAPISISAPALDMFTQFAALIAVALNEELSRETAEISLRDERAAGELREQFIAILGHDLRNPLQAIFAASDLLSRQAADPAIVEIASRIKVNSRRMSSLIDDVLDFARGRLGGGIGLRLSEIENINTGLTSVVKELQDVQPDRQIDYSFSVDCSVRCDIGRMQQVASNLIANALTHGTTGSAIKVVAFNDEHDLVFEVWNDGEPISAEHITKVFEPFWRRDSSAIREGLGLGLHICAQIVRAHGGLLSVTSTREAGTTFTARVPLHLLT